ncbi:D-erythronate dehydrogenase [Caldimonas taiwanensis]|uniref:D-erythronate dehydrogenase n=1 Tax=Caldimonas taiwanensis TaxID=307483 RepID=UPI0007816D3B|nr:D-erythronate dehydrogenase [Caldimonas taiwanensis]
MKILITGGAGFLGARLARELLQRQCLRGQRIQRLVLADLAELHDPVLSADARVHMRVGDLLAQMPALMAEDFDAVFHLASAVSAECEADFDLGLRANLDTTRALLDACRAQSARGGPVPLFVFSSSVAVYGSDPALPLPAEVDDRTLPTPQSSYGIHKFICEQLVADYTRKGYIDGRAARLMTVAVRPGPPNRAASSFLSSIVREPLAGLPAICPVAPDTEVALASPASTIAGLLTVAEASREDFAGRTALNLPALTVTVQQMLDALRDIGGQDALRCVRFQPDATIARIVGGWPSRFDSARARALGLSPDRDVHSIVRQYVRDHRQAVRNAQALSMP